MNIMAMEKIIKKFVTFDKNKNGNIDLAAMHFGDKKKFLVSYGGEGNLAGLGDPTLFIKGEEGDSLWIESHEIAELYLFLRIVFKKRPDFLYSIMRSYSKELSEIAGI